LIASAALVVGSAANMGVAKSRMAINKDFISLIFHSKGFSLIPHSKAIPKALRGGCGVDGKLMVDG
jgi:hypothetical protein